jgi:hypothetical protein
MLLSKGNCDPEHKHRCGVRYLLFLRNKKGLAWFRNYIANKNFSKAVWDDFYNQYKAGNKGEWGVWKNTLSEQQGLGI